MTKPSQAKKALRQAYWHRSKKQSKIVKTVLPPQPQLTLKKQQTEQPKQKPSPNAFLHTYSYRDPLNRERVFTQDFEPIIYKKMREIYGEGTPLLDVEYGEVLNRQLVPCWWR